jgi:hypothetical protein
MEDGILKGNALCGAPSPHEAQPSGEYPGGGPAVDVDQLDHEVALQAVVHVMKGRGFSIAGGDRRKESPYSMVLQDEEGILAIRVTATRAPDEPGYHPAQFKELQRFAFQNKIRRIAMAPVGLWPAEPAEDGRLGFYPLFKDLVDLTEVV